MWGQEAHHRLRRWPAPRRRQHLLLCLRRRKPSPKRGQRRILQNREEEKDGTSSPNSVGIVLAIALGLGLVTWGGCATGGHQRAMTGDTDKPGEQLVASYEKTAAKYQCQGTSVLVVEKAELQPSKVTPGQQLVSS